MKDAVAWHSRFAREFDEKYYHSPAFKERLAIWSEMIEQFVDPDANVLDAGCGSGVFSMLAAPEVRSVIGFDASPQMIALAEKRREQDRFTNVTFYVAALENLAAFSDRKFDLIMCSSVLEYVEDFWRAFEGLSEVLSDNGVLLFSVPNGVSFYRKAEHLAFRLTGWPAYYAHVRNVFSLSDVSKGLKTRAFEIVTARYYAAAPGLSAIARPMGRADLADTLFAVACRRSALQ
jgi:2-polyprenyl-6-hydroxyphenyl methylase/3-demethylubiquinone-9 3-methyltransferase